MLRTFVEGIVFGAGALARFEPAPDGRMKAVFREFLKKGPEVTTSGLGDIPLELFQKKCEPTD